MPGIKHDSLRDMFDLLVITDGSLARPHAVRLNLPYPIFDIGEAPQFKSFRRKVDCHKGPAQFTLPGLYTLLPQLVGSFDQGDSGKDRPRERRKLLHYLKSVFIPTASTEQQPFQIVSLNTQCLAAPTFARLKQFQSLMAHHRSQRESARPSSQNL
jgi:hypothetical protein